MPEGSPLQSHSRSPGWPTVWRSAPAPKVPSPFDDIPRSGPVCSRPSGSATVPTPGFLTPSPVSWLRSSSRVCCAPQPSLGCCSLQSVPLAFRSRTPRRGRWLPCRSSRSNPGAASAVLSPSTFTDSGDVRASSLAGSCRGLEAPFQPRSSHPPPPCGGGRHASRDLPVTLDLVRRTHLGPAVPSTSKLSSLRESVHTTQRSPVAWRPVLSWASSPLQSLAPARPGVLVHPPRPEASLLPLAARASRRDARFPGPLCVRASSWLAPRVLRCWRPSKPGGIVRGRPNRPARPVGGHRIDLTEEGDPGRAALRQQPRLP